LKLNMNGLHDDFREIMVEANGRHARFPDVSFDAYRQGRYETLDRFVSARRTVYLDMNFWISLRNPAEARKPKESVDLLDILRSGVESGLLLCPVSYAVFVELMKQKQIGDGRRNLARLMDELSMGVGIRNPFDIARIEYLTFFSQHVPRLANYIDDVWAPIGHLIHEVYPYQDEWPHEVMEQGRKVMCDVQWAMKMEHLAKTDLPALPSKAAEEINSARKIHLRGDKSFAHLFADELRGALEEVNHHIEETLKQMAYAGFESREIEIIEKQRSAAANDLLRAAVGSDSDGIPSRRIYAALHAAMRLDDKRRFKPNDLHDFEHASVAVAYCDLFLCDRPLAHLLTDSNVQKVIPNRCSVVSGFESAITSVKKLASPSL
jgi:hypothetical protein